MLQRLYRSLSEFVDAASGPMSERTATGSQQRGSAAWSGTATYEQAEQLAITGWDGPRAEVQSIVDRITPQIQRTLSPRLERRITARGRKVLSGRLAQGHPKHTVQRVRTEDATPSRTVRIGVNGNFNAGVEADTIRKQGAALLALCDAFTYLGVNTEIHVVFTTTNGRRDLYNQVVRVKSFDDQAGTDRLMFAIAHPAMLRRISFAAMELDGNVLRNYPGYGRTAKPRIDGIDVDLMVGADPSGVREAAKDPVAWVLAQIDGLGVQAAA